MFCLDGGIRWWFMLLEQPPDIWQVILFVSFPPQQNTFTQLTLPKVFKIIKWQSNRGINLLHVCGWALTLEADICQSAGRWAPVRSRDGSWILLIPTFLSRKSLELRSRTHGWGKVSPWVWFGGFICKRPHRVDQVQDKLWFFKTTQWISASTWH